MVAQVRANLEQRGISHDRSKFLADEFDAFVQTRPRFRSANYGSPEYRACVDEIRPAIERHYARNRHHPDYYSQGVAGMSLIDLLEMLADWKAASDRNPNLTFADSLPKAYEKHGISEPMQRHIEQTLQELGWLDGKPRPTRQEETSK